MLTHNRWPGNVDQLSRCCARSWPAAAPVSIEPPDLPPECRSTTRRVLTPLESMECDAIVEALLDTGGNKVEAARQLAMSRATIYRKIRDYGLTVPLEPA